MFNFALAIEHLAAGDKVIRTGWNGVGMYVHQQNPDANSKMTLPYFYMKTVQGDLVPWSPSNTDILARDWQVVTD